MSLLFMLACSSGPVQVVDGDAPETPDLPSDVSDPEPPEEPGEPDPGAPGDDPGSDPGTEPGTDADTEPDALPTVDPPLCPDACILGETDGTGAECMLYDVGTGTWIGTDAATSLHDRAREMERYIEAAMRPAGGLAERVAYTDLNRTDTAIYIGMGDASIWTGTYLATAALQFQTTGDPAAETRMNELVHTLHDWFNVSGQPGVMSRFAAPAGTDPVIEDVFDRSDSDHTAQYQGQSWRYLGRITRDQYQGVMLGYSLAYQATSDPSIREIIREDVVELVEELMEERHIPFRVETTDGLGFTVPLDMRYIIPIPSESSTGNPTLLLDLDDLENPYLYGFQEFHPRIANAVADQVPLLSWLPEIPRSGSAVMLASFFQTALLVTDGVPAYATRRQAILDHYEANFDWWWNIADNPLGHHMSECGDSYFGFNIRYMPMYNLAQLETDPTRLARIRDTMVDRMWTPTADHKNVWFAMITAANVADPSTMQSEIDAHLDQLAGFRSPPLVQEDVDLTGLYPADPDCPGQTTEAIDVSERTMDGFMWQRNPWKLTRDGNPLISTSGVDFLAAYWLARRHGFLDDDRPGTCTDWQ